VKLTNRILIVVCGCAGHGKDTLADMLAGQIPDADRDAFAAPLKVCVHLKTGIPMRILNGSQRDKEDVDQGAYGKTARKLMQEEGEEARQRIGLTVWMDRLADRFVRGNTRVVIVSDGRHPQQEMTALRERIADYAHVVFVRIVRPSVPVNREHISETAVADASDEIFDYKIVNDGLIGDLLLKAEALAVSIQSQVK